MFFPEPMDVNAESILEIYDLVSTKYDVYEAGDCMRIEFDSIEDYDLSDGSNPYEPFPSDEFTTCDFIPAATCSRISGNEV